MADIKISALTDGIAPADTDLIPIARGAGNAKLSFAQLRAGVMPAAQAAAIAAAIADGYLPPGVNDIGVAGTPHFGVGLCPAVPAGFAPLPLWGNYLHTASGSVMCWIPAFWYRIGHADNPTFAGWGLNSIDVLPYSAFADATAANAAGYALPRAFINAGATQLGFFVDKYQCSAAAGVAVSVRNGAPLSTNSAHNPIGGLTGAPANTYGGTFAAAKTRGAQFFPAMRYMHVALALLATAQAQASSSTAACAWWDGSATGLAGPKGNNNNALRDAADAAVAYRPDGYQNCGLTGSGVPFAKTTHNGQDTGVADLNGNMWEVSLGLTCVATTLNITAATQTNPVRITVAGHGLATGRQGQIDSVGGMTQLNGKIWTLTVIDANTLDIASANGTAWGAYTSGGTLRVGVWHALSESANAAALTGGNTLTTDAWGATGLAAHSAPLDVQWADNQVYAMRYGSAASQVLAGDTSGAAWLRTQMGLALPAGVSAAGTSAFGQDYYYQFVINELCPLAGGHWSDSSPAGVWAVLWSHARSSSFGNVGFRAASYL